MDNISNEDKNEKLAAELLIANKELAFQNNEKEKRAAELLIANKELAFQNNEKEKRANELIIANKELVFQNEEKQKRAAELIVANYARSLIEASRDALFTISPVGKIMDVNEAAVKVTGVSRNVIVGSDFFNYFTEPEKARMAYQQIFSKGFVADYPLTIKDNNLTDVLFNGSIYKDEKGNVLGAVVVSRDITEQKRIEKELLEAKIFAELATSIAEDAKQKAETATLIAENATKSKQQFLSNMSHEIRTPMNAIIGFTKVVLKTDLSAKQKEYVEAIKTSGDALIVLINDILDLAKVDAGKMTFENNPFNLKSSINSMIHLFEPKANEKNIQLINEFDVNIPEIITGDSIRLHQILINLLSNAVKFTNKGTVSLHTNLVSENDENVQIEFQLIDTGIGIHENKMDSIFENFQQASSSTSRIFGGTGLGLAISKQLVESQGGSIHVKSEIMEGSTFTVLLKFGKSNGKFEIENELQEQVTETSNIKILLVEDIALNQLLMKTILEDFGFKMEIASNGKIAVEKLKENSFDIVLMDLQMPVMNGFEATTYIRNELKSSIPIIALTADVTTVDVAKCKEVGMNDYLAKPVDEKLLYQKIINLVTQKKVVVSEIQELKETKKIKYTNLLYLNQRTKSNPALLSEMISLYLEQTPPLILSMKKSFIDKDWYGLHATIHKMIPSFSIMGISNDFELMAKKVLEYTSVQQEADSIKEMVETLEDICTEACRELKEELNNIKNNTTNE